MALTRKFLSAMGIEQDKVDEIINAHVEVTDALKEERDRYKADADSHSSNQDPSEDSQSSSPDSPAEDENDDSPMLKPRSKQWNPDPGAKANPEDLL